MTANTTDRSRPKLRMGDLWGAFGDLGTFLPLWLSLVVICGLDPTVSLIFAGVANIFTGYYFKIPMAVQPMKAIAAVAIAGALSSGTIMAAGVIMGLLMIVGGQSGVIDKLAGKVPTAVIRGVQWAVALQLTIAGVAAFVQDETTALFLGPLFWPSVTVFTVVVLLATCYRKGLAVTGLMLLVGGALATHAWMAAPTSEVATSAWRFSMPTIAEWTVGATSGVIPQLPMTLFNSVFAVIALGVTLFPEQKDRLNPGMVSVSVGVMNLITCPFGAMPVCHGSGGLAGQYAFGARTGASVIFLGILKVAVGISSATAFVGLIGHFPKFVLGIWVIVAGVELFRSTLADIKSHSLVAIALVPVATVALGSLPVGVLLAWVFCVIQSMLAHRTNVAAKEDQL